MTDNKIKLVVFDLDGTVVDAFGDIADAANFALGKLKHKALPEEHVRAGVGNGVRWLMNYCLGGATDDNTLQQAYDHFVAYYKEHNAERAFVLPGAIDSINLLREAKIKTAVISNKRHDLTVGTLQKLKLAGLFDEILGETDRFPRKPAPDALIYLMNNFNATPLQTVMIGDGPADVAVAQNANCRFVGMTTGIMSREQLKEKDVDVVLDSLAELAKALDRFR